MTTEKINNENVEAKVIEYATTYVIKGNTAPLRRDLLEYAKKETANNERLAELIKKYMPVKLSSDDEKKKTSFMLDQSNTAKVSEKCSQ